LSEFSKLPPRERAERYRQLAADAEKCARSAPSPEREAYLEIATQWRRFACRIEEERSCSEQIDDDRGTCGGPSAFPTKGAS
jgi:hypothetical protein